MTVVNQVRFWSIFSPEFGVGCSCQSLCRLLAWSAGRLSACLQFRSSLLLFSHLGTAQITTQITLHMADSEEQALEEVLNSYTKTLGFTNVCVQRLKSALWFSIGKIVDEETLKLGVNATPQFIGALTEMVWAQIGEPQRPLTATIRTHADIITR